MKKFILCLFIVLICITQKVNSLEKSSLENSKNEIENILLIGTDNSNTNKPSRSDCMIILTIDTKNKALRLTSLARDTLVNIPNIGYEKLNHAYAYGKEKLLLETINNNFNLDIKDYAVVDFKSFIEIVDTIGGVEVDVSEKEIDYLNKTIEACYGLNTQNEGNIKYINKVGNNKLNGYQTLAYARIRKMDTIYKRDERQRKILTDIANKLTNIPLKDYPKVISSVVKHIDVNMSIDKIFKLALISQRLANYDIKQLEFPVEKYRDEGISNESKKYVIKWDKEENLKILNGFIYNK